MRSTRLPLHSRSGSGRHPAGFRGFAPSWRRLALGPVLLLVYLGMSFALSPRRAEYWGKADCPGREEYPLARLVLSEAQLRPGMRVADIGAGGGFFSFRFARDVGREGHVVATDIDPHMIGQLHLERLRRAAWNVSPKLVGEDEVGLAPSSVDLALIVNTYQFRDCREARNRDYLRELARSLRPGGRVIIADGFVHTAGWVSPRSDGPTRCGNLPPAQLAALAGPHLTTLRITPLVRHGYRYAPHEEPGYVMVLQRAASVAASAP
jgi:SAM-dependent methyltransferase